MSEQEKRPTTPDKNMQDKIDEARIIPDILGRDIGAGVLRIINNQTERRRRDTGHFVD